MTRPPAPGVPARRPEAARLAAQMVVVLGATVVTGVGAEAVPGWRSVVASVRALGQATLPVA